MQQVEGREQRCCQSNRDHPRGALHRGRHPEHHVYDDNRGDVPRQSRIHPQRLGTEDVPRIVRIKRRAALGASPVLQVAEAIAAGHATPPAPGQADHVTAKLLLARRHPPGKGPHPDYCIHCRPAGRPKRPTLPDHEQHGRAEDQTIHHLSEPKLTAPQSALAGLDPVQPFLTKGRPRRARSGIRVIQCVSPLLRPASQPADRGQSEDLVVVGCCLHSRRSHANAVRQ